MANRANSPPTTSRYQLNRLMRGNARSRAPIIMGKKKFPRVAGMEGMRKKKIITTPCIVNSLLYVSDDTRSPCGVRSSMRISVAKIPPMRKKKVIVPRYSRPMRLWSLVRSHDLMP